ncbi:hypothetical protein BD410DRAFT_839765 [Rickenella mellea]|uniref:Uncharacterized protein n=1 Tax=Rickenella mellea TaxID=50990 RepID=A0A4Y7Q4J0_9AGAM|nr:hypothetical protein BD410DRAFT_839765 [Rickenella mellea]
MALVATQDWPKTTTTTTVTSPSTSSTQTMDSRQQRSHPSSPSTTLPATDPRDNSSQSAATPPQPPAPHNPYEYNSYQMQQHPQHPPQPPWPQMNIPMGSMNGHGPHPHQIHGQPGFYPGAMQFYPQHFPPPQMQQQHQQQQHQQQPGYPQQLPYFDPGQHAFAQWAYQQMMFNAQQQHQLAAPPPIQTQQQPSPGLRDRDAQRARSGSQASHSTPGTPTDYFPHANAFAVNPRAFPSGTPPPPPHAQQSGQPQPQYQGFHPYRRPEQRLRPHDSPGASASGSPGSASSPTPQFQPPYARADAAGSTTSLNSATGSSSSQRSRTNSNNSNRDNNTNASNSGSVRGKPPVQLGQHQRVVSSSSSQQSHRAASSSSTSSSQTSPSPPLRSTSSSSVPTPTSTAKRPSPLSQGLTYSSSTSTSGSRTSTSTNRPSISTSRAERRISRDDSDLAALRAQLDAQGIDSGSGIATGGESKSSGLKGRLRRALSFNPNHTLNEADEDATVGRKSKGRVSEADDGKDGDTDNETLTPPASANSPQAAAQPSSSKDAGKPAKIKKPSRAASMFNARFNASTDNISLSSTVSSASVMIRKLGSMGRLARRNSLAGITSLFKDKEKKKDKEDQDTSGKDKDERTKDRESGKRGKGGRAEASVSHVTAELDRMQSGTSGSDVLNGPGMEGLSPAAKLARQHTLKSNAEAAARARAQAEAAAERLRAERERAERERVEREQGEQEKNLPLTWERNTATRQGAAAIAGVVREDGMRLVVESDSDGDDAPLSRVNQMQAHRGPHVEDDGSGSDGEGTWRGHGADEDDEDVTIRVGAPKPVGVDTVKEDIGDDDEDDGSEVWAVGLRRSVERTRRPAKGILKNANTYSQDSLLEGPNPPFAQHLRHRANSYDAHTGQQGELGPLARMPSPDPDHIDGLHKHAHHSSSSQNGTVSSSTSTSSSSSGPGSTPFLPPLSFETESPESLSPSLPEKPLPAPHAVFSHPGMNSSAPALSSMLSAGAAHLTHRAATAPAKRLTFAANLSIYDTFSPAAYDRRSEPATWSRLTPALAQRIKEELNSYKMEEMEVHAASRVHTQFFV